MNIFNPVTLKWWQVGLFKISLVSFGVFVGANQQQVFQEWLTVLLVIFVVTSLYLLTTVWWKTWNDGGETIHIPNP